MADHATTVYQQVDYQLETGAYSIAWVPKDLARVGATILIGKDKNTAAPARILCVHGLEVLGKDIDWSREARRGLTSI